MRSTSNHSKFNQQFRAGVNACRYKWPRASKVWQTSSSFHLLDRATPRLDGGDEQVDALDQDLTLEMELGWFPCKPNQSINQSINQLARPISSSSSFTVAMNNFIDFTMTTIIGTSNIIIITSTNIITFLATIIVHYLHYHNHRHHR